MRAMWEALAPFTLASRSNVVEFRIVDCDLSSPTRCHPSNRDAANFDVGSISEQERMGRVRLKTKTKDKDPKRIKNKQSILEILPLGSLQNITNLKKRKRASHPDPR